MSGLYRALTANYLKGREKDGQHSSSQGNVMLITWTSHPNQTALCGASCPGANLILLGCQDFLVVCVPPGWVRARTALIIELLGTRPASRQ
jgi:hypothetical protein